MGGSTTGLVNAWTYRAGQGQCGGGPGDDAGRVRAYEGMRPYRVRRQRRGVCRLPRRFRSGLVTVRFLRAQVPTTGAAGRLGCVE
jgi:hypothetical protein